MLSEKRLTRHLLICYYGVLYMSAPPIFRSLNTRFHYIRIRVFNMIGCESMLEFMLAILANALNGSTTLHSTKIDRNTERLRQYDWFEEIYQDDRYRRLFFANRHVRKYLQHNRRVNQMMKKKRTQAKFIDFSTNN